MKVKPKGHYVYKVLVDGICRYIGSGKNNRYLHGNSGRSSVAELNRAYFSGALIEVIIIKDNLTKDKSLQEEINIINSLDNNNLFNKSLPNATLNRITKYELRLVIEDWLVNGRGILQKSFNKIYQAAGKINKEVDWVKAIPNSKHYSKELLQALKESSHKDAKRFLNSEIFNVINLSADKALTTRIIEMDIVLKFEEEMMRKEEALLAALARIEVLESQRSWQEVATDMLNEGIKQQVVADTVNKGIATIKRLAKQLKESKGVLPNENRS